MIDINKMTPDPNESNEDFMGRVYNVATMQFTFLKKRESNHESAEEHYNRFMSFENSIGGRIFKEPTESEDYASFSFIERIRMFYSLKKKLIETLDNDIFYRMKYKNGEPDWLGRVDDILFDYSWLIDTPRVWLRETKDQIRARQNRFRNFRNQIDIDIKLVPLKEDLLTKAEAKKVKDKIKVEELAKLEVRKEYDDIGKESQKKEEKKKQNERIDEAKYKTFIVFIYFICLFGIFQISDSLKTMVVLGGISFVGVLILSSNKKMFNRINSNDYYRVFINDVFKFITLFNGK